MIIFSLSDIAKACRMLARSPLYIIYLVASIAKVSSIAVKNTTFNRYTEIYFGVPIYKAIFAVGKKNNSASYLIYSNVDAITKFS